MKTGLVLEGGGVRGIYTAGVLDVLMEHSIDVDGVIGVSAGAIHGCSYLSRQHGRSLRYYKNYCHDPRFMSFQSWLKTGDIVGAKFCYDTIPNELDLYDYEAFNQNPASFYVVCTNVETGKAEYFQLTDMKRDIDYMRASASLPYFSKLVELDGKKYLDGGCSDSIPLQSMEKIGYERNIVVLTRDESYEKKDEFTLLAKLVYRKFPKFVQALLSRSKVYSQQLQYIKKKELDGSAFVIRPSKPLEIGRLEKNPEEVQKIYDIGRKDALDKIDALKNWLSING